MTKLLACVPAADNVPADPCGSLDGVGYVPVLVDYDLPGEIDTSESAQLFAWSLSLIVLAFFVGNLVGALIRVVRSA